MADETQRYCARVFSDAEMAWIRGLIEAHPELNRAALSRRVCEELGWRKADGGLKDMSCRVAMLRMDRDGLIALPPPLWGNGNGRTGQKITAASNPRFPVSCAAGELGPLDFEIVDGHSRHGRSRLWNEFIQRYHYLGYKPLPGAQIRYFVHARCELLALLGFGAAAWTLAARDKFIGWTGAERIENLHLVTNNARFLILPWVQSRNLASRILGAVAKRLREDWQERYQYCPALLETYVEHNRHRGTCYRAANWLHIGQTRGRGKLDRYGACALPIKDIFVYPLTKDFREQLRGGHCEAVDRSVLHREEDTHDRRQPRSAFDAPGSVL